MRHTDETVMLDDFLLKERMARQRLSNYGDLAEAMGISPNTMTMLRRNGVQRRLHKNSLCYVLQCELQDISVPKGKLQLNGHREVASATADIDDAKLTAELNEIFDRNTANGTWLSSAEMRQKLIEAGINVG